MTVSAISYTEEPSALENVREQLEHWRSTRAKGKPIPKPLWKAIRGLTEHYPYRQIASRLKINIYRLQAKIEEQPQTPSHPSRPHFIEVPLSHLSPLSPLPILEQKGWGEHPLGSIELSRPDGALLKASGLNPKDLCSFVQSFLR